MKIIAWAVASRLLIIGISCITNSIFEDYDTSQSLFLNSRLYHDAFHHHQAEHSCDFPSILDQWIFRLFGGLSNWDAVYFLSHAKFGYVFENGWAFFPLLPGLIKLLASAIELLVTSLLGISICWSSSALIAGVLISLVSYTLAAKQLYLLSQTLFGENSNAPTLSVIFFLISPANIFLTAIYTESLFCYLSWKGISQFTAQKPFLASFIWGITGLLRSNSLLYCGFFVYKFVFGTTKANFVRSAVEMSACCIFTILPYVCFQFWAYLHYCVGNTAQGLNRPWCNHTLPHIYPFVQAEYWNQGFLRYWTLKQLPNFAVAAPLVLYSLYGIYTYASGLWKRHRSLSALIRALNDQQNEKKPNSSNQRDEYSHQSDLQNKISSVKRLRPQKVTPNFYLSAQLFPHVVYWGAFLSLILVNFHVQTMARMLSSTLPIYWFFAHVVESTVHSPRFFVRLPIYLIVFYGLLWSYLGTVLFSNFYPWT